MNIEPNKQTANDHRTYWPKLLVKPLAFLAHELFVSVWLAFVTVIVCWCFLQRGDAYLICSPSTLPKVRTLLSAVSAADSLADAGCAPDGDTSNTVISCLRGQRLCRFVLEAVYVLLPLLRPALGGRSTAATAAFIDVAMILLRCTLRGQQVSYLEM